MLDEIQEYIDAVKPENIQKAQSLLPVFEDLLEKRRIAFSQFLKAVIDLTGETDIDIKVQDSFGNDWGSYMNVLESERGKPLIRAEWRTWQDAEINIGIFLRRIGSAVERALKTLQKQTSSKTGIIPSIPPELNTKISFRGNLKELAAFFLDLESTGRIEHPTDKQIAAHFTYNGNEINIDSLRSIRARDL